MRRLTLSILFALGLAAPAPGAPLVRFEHLTLNDGLPENSVRAILQDHHGYLWFGTQNGVARYDGEEMRVHLPDPDDSRSIGVRFVLAMAEDDTGAIWMGSYSAGVSRFDAAREQFVNFQADADSLPGPGIADIRAAADGVWITTNDGILYRARGDRFERIDVPFGGDDARVGLSGLLVGERDLWVGSSGRGLAVQDRAEGAWRWLRAEAGDPESLPSDFVTFVLRDPQGRVWVGGRSGLALHSSGDRFAVFRPRPDLGESDPNYLVCAAPDGAGGLWLGSAVGLYHFDPVSGTFVLYAHDPEDPDSPVRGPVLSILRDRSGIVWAGSWHTGLNKLNPAAAKFDVYLHDAADPGSLDDDAIGAVWEDRRGTLWVGTGSRSSGGTIGSLNYRERGAAGFRRIPYPEQGEYRVRTVTEILEVADGTLWLGTNLGVWQVDAGRRRIERPPALADAPQALYGSMATDMAHDEAGRIWVATWLRGLHRYDPVAGDWRSYVAEPGDPASLAANDLSTVCLDAAGTLWVGTDSGHLQVYDPATDGFRSGLAEPIDLESVLHVIRGEGDEVIVGTGAGILVCRDARIVRRYTSHDGLPSDFASRIVRDGKGDLWASTGLGLAWIRPEISDVTVFDTRDGLPRNEIHFAATRTADGRILFGGHYGLVAFRPEAMERSAFVPPVRITELRIRDKPVRVGTASPLSRALEETHEIRLDPDQNDFSLTFAALDFAHPERNRYRYRLEPHDAAWRTPARGRTSHYTNLGPGRYEFSVMGSNSDGVWNPVPATLRLVISPPWYRTGWALGLYVLAVVVLSVGIYRTLLLRERMRMALEIERAEASHLQNLDQLKSRFFANISHEFRTPLTLLMSPLQRLQDDPASGTSELFATMARNARRLGRLIDQLLDLSRLEADRMPARWRHGDWCRYLRVLASPFVPLAEQRDIVFGARWPEDAPPAWHEPDLLDKVFVNLLSNALKFTPAGGEIAVAVDVDKVTRSLAWPGAAAADGMPGEAITIRISVANTGTHIPAVELPNVFDRFHQVVESSESGDLGSGIGLALVKELAEWAGGEVSVASNRETGTAFTVTLPLFVSAPPASVSAAGGEREPDIGAADPLTDAAGGEADESAEPDDGGLPRVLMVEDNADLRQYVREELADEYQVLVAANGKAGLSLAKSEIPDLVLSDVMMPVMDGIELCRRLKDDDLTSHIPVILLTARAETDARRDGLESGADDYVAKPFDLVELRIRIRNLIEQRRLLAERYDKLEVARPGRAANPVPSADDRFLIRAREIIAENLEDPEFRVDALCREIGMSRTQLHRKLKAVSGRSAGDFLRVERLNKAAEMLGRGEGNVTQVAYSVGYRSLSQFAKAFREQFGMAPSDFEA